MQEIRHFRHHEIDKEKWDDCINNAPNGLIYALSWYLDVVAPGWEALVLGDYQTMMPLPVRSKFGIPYIFVPIFTQQLGVISKISDNNPDIFIESIPKKFRIVDVKLNESNNYKGGIVQLNNNHRIYLNRHFSLIQKEYNRNCSRNIKKAKKAGFTINHSMAAEDFVNFVMCNLSDQFDTLNKTDYGTLLRLATTALSKRLGEVVSLQDQLGVTHAAGFYLFDKKRLIFSVCASTKSGKENQAMYFLVDKQLQRYAGRFDWYDFSGSNKKGIAYFNSTFGAKPITYQTIRLNRLPYIVKWIKR